MQELPYQQHPEWKAILERLSQIRQEGEYTPENIEFIIEQLQSFDDRIRGGAALAAEGCLFEPRVLNLVVELAETDGTPAIRKAAIQALAPIIHEGVMQGLEDEVGASTGVDDAEEWQEFQEADLREDYLRVKHLLLSLLELEENWEIQESALSSLADLGFLPQVQEKIEEFFRSSRQSAQLVALHAMGKFPHYWEEHLLEVIRPDTPVALLKEAISACYSSESAKLARAIEGVLEHEDPEVLRYALLTLANIHRTEGLEEILQRFCLHEHPLVQEAAREGLEQISRRNLGDYLRNELGFEE